MGGIWAGRFEEGIRSGQRGSASLTGATEPWWEGHLFWVTGVNAAALGALDVARAAGQATYAVGERSGDPRLRSCGRWLGGWVDILEGRHEAARVACQEASDLAPDPLCKAVASQWLGFVCLERGSPPLAVTHLEDAADRYTAFGFAALEAWACAWLGRALVAQGRAQDAMAAARKALAIGEGAGFALATGLAHRAMGEAARALGDLVAARTELTAAWEALHLVAARPDAALARVELAASCHALGDKAAAIEHLDGAARDLSGMGVRMARARVRELATTLEMPIPAEPPAPDRSQ